MIRFFTGAKRYIHTVHVPEMRQSKQSFVGKPGRKMTVNERVQFFVNVLLLRD